MFSCVSYEQFEVQIAYAHSRLTFGSGPPIPLIP
jgi:hypothetical protein